MGAIAALGAAMSWSLASLLFERFGRATGGLALNLIKCLLAVVLLLPTLWVLEGKALPSGMSLESLLTLALSGLIGLSIGDTLWFGCLLRLGARRALLLFTLAPPMTAALGAVWLAEPIGPELGVGMAVTLLGVVWVIRERTPPPGGGEAVVAPVDRVGLALGISAAACQAVGSVLTKLAGTDVSALEVTIVRLGAGTVGLFIAVIALGRFGNVKKAFVDRRSGAAILGAAFLGTYVGVWLMNAGFLLTSVGIAATLNSTSPIFVLPLAALFFGEPVSARAVVGATIAVLGVGLLFLGAVT